jgi:hypothetical protein
MSGFLMFHISVFHSVYQRFCHFISLFLIFHISYFVSVVLIIYVSDSLSTYQFLVLYINFFYTSASVSYYTPLFPPVCISASYTTSGSLALYQSGAYQCLIIIYIRVYHTLLYSSDFHKY